MQAQKRSRKEMVIREVKRKKHKRNQVLWCSVQVLMICVMLTLFADVILRLNRIEDAIGIDEPAIDMPLTEILQAATEEEPVEEVELGNIPQYARECELDEVAKPVKLEGQKLLNKLRELGETNEVVAAIAENSSSYPENLLAALAMNPEMADFVSNYPGDEVTYEGGLTTEEKKMDYPLFLQWDPRWGYQSYGESNIAIAGCGPTALSMALYYQTRNEFLTPAQIAEYAMENDYYMFGTGTMWSLMEEVPVHYGVNSEMLDTNEFDMEQALDKGEILICSVRQGDFTAGGHFIVLYGYDDTGFFVNDPNCVARSRQTWDYEQLKRQIKQIWALSK